VSRAGARIAVPGSLVDAEALWYDPDRWPSFVDGFARVVRRDPDWPREGTLVWDSLADGRGRVVETVRRWSPREGQTAAVEDPKLRGTQEVAFRPTEGGVQVELGLDYRLKGGNLFMKVTDLLFIRRAVRDSLRRTLVRYARERWGDVELGVTS